MKLIKYILMSQIIFFLAFPALGKSHKGHSKKSHVERGTASVKKHSMKKLPKKSKKEASLKKKNKKRDMASEKKKSKKKNKKAKKSNNNPDLL